jgi:hypothetical protein
MIIPWIRRNNSSKAKAFKVKSESRNKTVRSRRLTCESLEQRRVLASVISEVFAANNDTNQYVEFRGTPDATIADGTYFTVIEGWGAVPGGRGYIHSVIDLSGLTFGSNGFLVVAQLGHPHQINSSSASLVSTTAGFSGLPGNRWSDASTISDRFAHVFIAGNFLLVQASARPVPGTDIDADDNGTIDGVAAGWTVIDSVGLLGRTATPATSYGKITFAEDAAVTVPPNTSLVITERGGYVGRIGSSSGASPEDWVHGNPVDDLSVAGIDLKLTFGTLGDPTPLVYAGRSIDHVGTFNFNGGALGSIVMDTNGDNVFGSGDTPLAGVQITADLNQNNIRDDVTVAVQADNLPLGSDLTNLFPNATLTIADRSGDNIGFRVRTVTNPNNPGDRIFSHEGVGFNDIDRKIKVAFYNEANSVSVVANGAEGLRDSYGRLEVYDKNNVLLQFTQTGPMRRGNIATLSISRPAADIKYAIFFTNDDVPNSSPFGSFDNLVYSFPEFSAISDANGQYSIEQLPVGNYTITPTNTAGKVLWNGTQSYQLNVLKTEHLVNAHFGFRDNQPPQFSDSSFSVPENSIVGTIAGQITAIDPDAGQTVGYEFLDNAGPFAIDPITGTIRVANAQPWDFETTSPLVIRVRAFDSLTPPAASIRNITISPRDVNESPVIAGQQFTLAENSANNTPIGNIAATDPDQGAAGTFTYAIGAGGPTNVFSVNPTTGVLSVLDSSRLDFEQQATWLFPVTVRDGGTPALSSTATITVRITDVNEPPRSLSFTNVVSLAETANVATPVNVATIGFLDDALGTNTLSLGGEDAALFSISNRQLRFQSQQGLDFETKSQYRVSVMVDDPTVGTTPDSSIEFTLAITDINEAPTDLTITPVVQSLPESANTSTPLTVAQLQIADDAIGTNSLSLAGPDARFFSISGTNLQFSPASGLDFETKSSYQVTVRLVDNTIPGTQPISKNFDLSISDVNEPPTAVSLENVVSNINESRLAADSRTLATIRFIDDALGTNEFRLSGDDAALFEIVGNQLVLKAGAVFDFETKSSYAAKISVVDPTLPVTNNPSVDYFLSVNNRPEVQSITDGSGGTIGAGTDSIRVLWDSPVIVGANAFKLQKLDVVGLVNIPRITNTLVNGRTITTLQFSGPYVRQDGKLNDGFYYLEVDGALVRQTNTQLLGESYTSPLVTIFHASLPGRVEVSGAATFLRGEEKTITLNVTGIDPSPTSGVDYSIDIDGNGTADLQRSGGATVSFPTSYSIPGSYTILITATHNGTVVATGSHIVDVSPTTSVVENWLSSMDTDRDSTINALDVLGLVNAINRSTSGPPPYQRNQDVDRDGTITALDVLAIVNYLNAAEPKPIGEFSQLVMQETGSVRGLTNNANVTGQINSSSRELFVSLNGLERKNASQFVQPDGSFTLTDAAIAALFGNIPDTASELSLSTRSGTNFSLSSDKRFRKLPVSTADFRVTSAVANNGEFRVSWSSNGAGNRYKVFAYPVGGTTEAVKTGLSSTSTLLELSRGNYELFVEAQDGAGNVRRTETILIAVP